MNNDQISELKLFLIFPPRYGRRITHAYTEEDYNHERHFQKYLCGGFQEDDFQFSTPIETQWELDLVLCEKCKEEIQKRTGE